MNKSKKLYILQHTYAYGLKKVFLESKMMGVLDDREKAEENIDFYYSLEGFEDYPRECFECVEFELDKNQYWLTGFEERRKELEAAYEYEEEYYGE